MKTLISCILVGFGVAGIGGMIGHIAYPDVSGTILGCISGISLVCGLLLRK